MIVPKFLKARIGEADAQQSIVIRSSTVWSWSHQLRESSSISRPI